MVSAIFAATIAVLAQTTPQLHAKTTVIAPPLVEPESIVRAELEFARGASAAAIQIIDSAIEHEQHAETPDAPLLANLYNCRAWVTLKAPDTTPFERYQNMRNAEAYAARAAEVVGASDLYWHDYAAIRIRRELDEGQLDSMASRV